MLYMFLSSMIGIEVLCSDADKDLEPSCGVCKVVDALGASFVGLDTLFAPLIAT